MEILKEKIHTPYNKIPFQGFLFPVKMWGYFKGKMTASCKASLALSNPATSDHLTFGFSVTTHPIRLSFNLASGSSLSLSLDLY